MQRRPQVGYCRLAAPNWVSNWPEGCTKYHYPPLKRCNLHLPPLKACIATSKRATIHPFTTTILETESLLLLVSCYSVPLMLIATLAGRAVLGEVPEF